ncbi:acyltransferase family protein [Paenibacillus anseongensis]|uniref:Acyltransferase family protein n=2 Tax=Paenibacillus anseongense TaxID=2682845 RepID=A0ABW9U1F0_9BACL|nr:acyltransferase [Paenibacillus sp. CGMCC 1.16610]MVQ33843.1 acyltransferase family protein [Paenibacillus anseongense]
MIHSSLRMLEVLIDINKSFKLSSQYEILNSRGESVNKLYNNFLKANSLLEGRVSIYLDFLRGLAAILVLMEHLGSRLFLGYGYLQNPTVIIKLLYLLNLLGGPSVIVFFVLSGLFISRSVLKSIVDNKWSWKSYLVNRLSRLYVVLIPALCLTLIADKLASYYFDYSKYSDNYTNIKEFVGNLFYLQNIYVGNYGSNGPLWSLGYEFWYYMLFPIIILLLRNQKKILKVAYLFTALTVIFLIGQRMSYYFLIWLVGMLVLLLPATSRAKNKFIMTTSFLLVCLAMFMRPLINNGRLFVEHHTNNLFIIDFFIGLSLGLLIYILIHGTAAQKAKTENKNKWFEKTSKLVASFSFSLYLIHYPIINFVYYWASKNGFNGLQPNLLSVLIEILIIALMCTIAFMFSRITEVRTNVVRAMIMNILERFNYNHQKTKVMKMENNLSK